MRAPLVVAVGGTLRTESSTEKALRIALEAAAENGARTLMISGPQLRIPPYDPAVHERSTAARDLLEAIREADGVILGTPGYHGGVSGLVKNALDYTEDLKADARPYLDGRAVGSVATGAGWQGAVTALNALRGVVHALRGWNTPLGVAINTADRDGESCPVTVCAPKLRELGRQVAWFARRAA